jgi:hypothetical protein
MGSKGDKPRKAKHPLPKVPKYEEPNEIPLAGLGGGMGNVPGRYGHSADHRHDEAPGRFGRFFLRLLGPRPKQPGPNEP